MEASTARERSLAINAFMVHVYKWMSFGLLLTAMISWTTLNSPELMEQLIEFNLKTGKMELTTVCWFLMIAEIGLVFYLASKIGSMSGVKATILFMAYAGMNGLTLSPILNLYTGESIFMTFAITSGMFGTMALYGTITKKDLTSFGSFLLMGLIGLIIAMVVNMFFQNSMVHLMISCVGVIIFMGLTAYDAQKIKEMGRTAPYDDPTAIRRGAIMGALALYLDFINLFMYMLQFLGVRK